MKSWKGNRNFLTLLKADNEVKEILPTEELEKIFNYEYYLQHVDEIFRRLGLTKSQWQGSITNKTELKPRSI